MDSLQIPKTEKEKNTARLSCFLSVEMGTVPYCRGFGMDINIDATMPAELTKSFALAVQGVSKYIPEIRITDGYIDYNLDGKAQLFMRFENE